MKTPSVMFSLALLALTGCEQGAGDSTSTTPASATPSIGETVFKRTCKVCHSQGINGAPIYGNAAMWSERITQGIPTLVEHASNGYGLMPAKGGNTALTEEEITAAVTYMVDAVKP
ncbi:cytochrome c5 family protein [bacterium]|nr:cytochrome c5 family protein [bacterium]